MPREIKAPPAKIETSTSKDGKHSIQFKESSHRYKWTCDCHKETSGVGATTFIKGGYPVSQGLISWQKGQALESLWSNLTVPSATHAVYDPREGFWPVSQQTKIELFAVAKAADRATAQAAADIGTLIHEFAFLIETGGDVNGLMNRLEKLPEDVFTLVKNGIDKFLAWRKDNHDKLVGAELLVASPTYNFFGKIDKLAYRNGKLILSDYKSSKDIYLDQFIQMGTYAIGIFEWLGLTVEGFEILRFGKEDGEFETLLIDDKAEMMVFVEQAIRCRQTFEFKKLENDPRWKYEPN